MGGVATVDWEDCDGIGALAGVGVHCRGYMGDKPRELEVSRSDCKLLRGGRG